MYRLLVLVVAVALLLVSVGCAPPSNSPDGASPVATQASSPAAPEAEAVRTASEVVAEAFGEFDPVSKKGRGDSVVGLPPGLTAAVVSATHKGKSNFAVEAIDEQNASIELLVNTVGKYSGTTFVGSENGTPARLKVTADGSWTLKASPVSTCSAFETKADGKGDAVMLYEGDVADWTITHDGESNFSVRTLGAETNELPVNEIGEYSGTIPMAAGPMVVIVNADGKWTISAD